MQATPPQLLLPSSTPFSGGVPRDRMAARRSLRSRLQLGTSTPTNVASFNFNFLLPTGTTATQRCDDDD